MRKTEKELNITREEKKLRKLYENLPENQIKLVSPLIQNAAFMKATLEELQAAINANGTVEEYRNGANQNGRKITSEVQAYNAMIKNYHNVIGALKEMLPPESKTSGLAALVNAYE